VRDPVRVLVRREGSTNSQESVSSVTPGNNLKHTYVYLSITGSARTDASANPDSGPGAIGSGRNANPNGQMSEEASRAKEYKLETLVKMLDDYPMWQAVIHVGTDATLEAVVMKLASRNWETIYLVRHPLFT
jgi:translation initiation factor 4A